MRSWSSVSASAATEFFLKVVDAQIIFKIDDIGKPKGLVLRQMGREQYAGRIEGNSENVQEWFGRRERKVDPALLDNYVGRYQLPGGVVFTVTREGDRLFSQQTGQQKLEIFAESDRVFFAKVFDGQITFEVDGTGPAKAIIMRQNSRDIRAPRISE